MTRGFRLHSRIHHKTKPGKVDGAEPLRPQRRKTGEYVTILNNSGTECRWPYSDPGPEMVLCGRAIVRGKPYCAAHQALVSARKQPQP